FAFLCLISLRFGFRSAVATVVLLGTILLVVSLRFELRHVFYIYAFPLIAWASVIWLSIRWSATGANAIYRRARGDPIARELFPAEWKPMALVAASVAGLALGIFAAIYLALSAARMYQADKMKSEIADWLGRRRIDMQFDTSD